MPKGAGRKTSMVPRVSMISVVPPVSMILKEVPGEMDGFGLCFSCVGPF